VIERVDAALAAGLGSAAAVSVGDGGVEVARYATGYAWRPGLLDAPPDPPAIDESWCFDVASLTKPMVTARCAMQLVRDGRADEVLDYIDAVDAGVHA